MQDSYYTSFSGVFYALRFTSLICRFVLKQCPRTVSQAITELLFIRGPLTRILLTVGLEHGFVHLRVFDDRPFGVKQRSVGLPDRDLGFGLTGLNALHSVCRHW